MTPAERVRDIVEVAVMLPVAILAMVLGVAHQMIEEWKK